jgi:lysophospholipase L1-like esterase
MSLVAVAALLTTACLEAAGPWVGPSAGARVGVAGDSQIQIAQYGPGLKEADDPDHRLTDALNAAGYQASVAGTIGSNTRDLVRWSLWLAPGAQVVALAYGANDMNTQGSDQTAVPIAEAEANLRGFIDRVDPPGDDTAICFALVEMPEESTAWGHDVWGPRWNAVLSAIAAERGDVVVSWAELADTHPEWLAPDQVHQTAEGQEAFRQAIVAGVQACSAA